jgi:hypothetical protein
MSLAVATAVLIAIGYRQTKMILSDAKVSRSLAACDRYNYDPILDRCQRRLRMSDMVWANPTRYRIDVITILNYLDGLATGVRLGTYDEPFVLHHMRSTLVHHVKDLLDDEKCLAFEIKKADYENLLWLYDRWDEYGQFNSDIKWQQELADATKRQAERRRHPS